MQEKLNSPLDNVAKIFCQKMTQQSQKGQAERSSTDHQGAGTPKSPERRRN